MAFSHGSKAVVLVNGVDLSAFLMDAGFPAQVDQAETSTFGATAKSYINGLIDATFALQGYFDGSANAIDAELASLFGGPQATWTYLPAGDGLGNVAIGVAANVSKYEVHTPIHGVAAITIDNQSNVGRDGLIVLQPMALQSAVENGTAVDHTTLTSNGGVAYLQATAVAGAPAATIKVQHSVDNVTFVDLVTFASVTAVGAQRSVVAAGTTVNRYLRAIVFAIGGASSVTFNVAFGRK